MKEMKRATLFGGDVGGLYPDLPVNKREYPA